MGNPWDKWREISPPTKRLNNKGEWELIPGKESREERYKRELHESYKKNDDTPKTINKKKLLNGNVDYYRKVNYRLTSEDRRLYTDRKQWEKDNEGGRWIGREIVKPVATGLASALDIPSMAWNAGTWAGNKVSGGDMSYAPYPSELVGKGVDKLTSGFSEGETESVLGKGIEFGSSMYGGGMLAKGLKAAAPTSKAVKNVSPWLGSTEKGHVTGGAAVGAITQGAEDLGASPLGAAGIGLGVGIGVPAYGRKLMTDSARKFNMKVHDAAKRQGIDIPRVSVDKSKSTKIAHTVAEHSLISGEGLTAQQHNTNLTLRNALERILDNTSTKKTLDNQRAMTQLYEKSSVASKGAVVKPLATLESIPHAKKFIRDSIFITETRERDYASMLDNLSDAVKGINVPEAERGLAPINKLIEQKKKLNKEIQKLTIHEWMLKDALKIVRDGIKTDINSYAKSNPIFKENWDAAENLYARMAKRSKQYKELGIGDIINPDIYTNPRIIANNYLKVKHDKRFVSLIGEGNRKHFDDLITAVEALPTTKVSGLAKNMKIMSAIGTAAAIMVGGGTMGAGALAGGVAYVGVDYLAHQMINKGKSFERLVRYAQNQTPENAKKAKNTIEKEAGMSLDKLNSKLIEVLNSTDISNKARIGVSARDVSKEIAKDEKRWGDE